MRRINIHVALPERVVLARRVPVHLVALAHQQVVNHASGGRRRDVPLDELGDNETRPMLRRPGVWSDAVKNKAVHIAEQQALSKTIL